jgi:hypothetical protein
VTKLERQRRYRESLKARPRLDDIPNLTDTLVKTRYLKQWDSEDPVEIAKAVREVLLDWIDENRLDHIDPLLD